MSPAELSTPYEGSTDYFAFYYTANCYYDESFNDIEYQKWIEIYDWRDPIWPWVDDYKPFENEMT